MTYNPFKSRIDARIPDHAAWAARGRWREAYESLCAAPAFMELLAEFSQQATTSELALGGIDDADYEHSHNTFILKSRAAIADHKKANKK